MSTLTDRMLASDAPRTVLLVRLIIGAYPFPRAFRSSFPANARRWSHRLSTGWLARPHTERRIIHPSRVTDNPRIRLPYRGLGSGIKRALEAWPQIGFIDDREGCLFTATVYRTEAISSMKEFRGKVR